jgi:chromosome segregation ATPase
LIADITTQLSTEKLQYDARLDYSTKQRELIESECDK